MKSNSNQPDLKDGLKSPRLPGETPRFKVISHSSLIYWWPVWAVGFAIAALTYFQGTRLAIVPEGSTVTAIADRDGKETFELTVPNRPTQSLNEATSAAVGQEPFPFRIVQNRDYGIVYAIVVLVVILATTVTLRGLWSVINALAIAFLVLLFVYMRWWHPILNDVGRLPIYASAAAYLVPSTVLFVFWACTVFIFDLRRFIIFTPGQLIVHREVGDMQQVYDTGNVNVVKRLNDFIRHRLLGLGAGDLLVTTDDGRHVFELPNVLFADRKVREIAEVMKTRPIMTQ
jgi:hypothetical protein